MRRVFGLLLSLLIVIPQNLFAQTLWTDQAIKHFEVYKKSGALAYIKRLEKDLNEPLAKQDKEFFTKVLSKSFRQDPPKLPEISKKKNGIEFSSANVNAYVEFTTTEDGILWTINGKTLDTKNKNSEEISKNAWAILSAQYNLGPYPSLESSKTSFLWNLILPKAEAGWGTVIGILVGVAAIAGIVYYVNKSTKATQRAVERAGASVERGVDRVSGAASSAIGKVGDSAASLIDSTRNTVDAGTNVINSHSTTGN